MIRTWSINGLNLFDFRSRSTNYSTLFDLWFVSFRLDWPCSFHDLIIFDPKFDPGFGRIRTTIWPCLTHDSTLFDFDPVQMVTLPCSFYDSILFDSWFDPVRQRIWPCSSHDLTRLDPGFGQNRTMIGPWLTYDSTLFDPWFDSFWVMNWPCSIHGSSIFDLWVIDLVWLTIRNRLFLDSTLID